MVDLGSGSQREVDDIMLTRYACYRIAQTYFAIQTRRAELSNQPEPPLFQWSTTSRNVKDGNAGHITREPEQVKAFRDSWRDGIHS